MEMNLYKFFNINKFEVDNVGAIYKAYPKNVLKNGEVMYLQYSKPRCEELFNKLVSTGSWTIDELLLQIYHDIIDYTGTSVANISALVDYLQNLVDDDE